MTDYKFIKLQLLNVILSFVVELNCCSSQTSKLIGDRSILFFKPNFPLIREVTDG